MRQFCSLLFLSAVLAMKGASIDYGIEGEVAGLDGQTFQVMDYDNNNIICSGKVRIF